jgi:tetratricopeptide (TPR) repeat protein
MEQKKYERASEVLEQCYELVKSQPYTFLECFLAVRNNQACLWRSLGKVHKGLTYLKKAERMLEQNKDVYNGVTYLNLAVVYNQVGE